MTSPVTQQEASGLVSFGSISLLYFFFFFPIIHDHRNSEEALTQAVNVCTYAWVTQVPITDYYRIAFGFRSRRQLIR